MIASNIFGQNEFSCKQNLSNSTSLPVFLSWKTNGVQTNAGHDNTEHALTINLVFVLTYCYYSKPN